MSEGDQPVTASGSRGILIAAILAFLAGVAAMAGGYQWFGPGFGPRPAPPTPTPSPTATMSAAAKDVALTALDARERELNDRIAELEARLASVDTDSRVASSFASRAEGLLVAFATRRALDRGLALGYLEGQLRARFQTTEPSAVATILDASREPVTLEELRLALDTLSPKLLVRSSDESWWTGFRRELGNLVIIRQEGAPNPLPSDRLRRARRLLDAGQVEAALAEVARLPGSADAEGWMAAAKRYVATRRALDAIETAALQGRAIAIPAPVPSPSPTPGPSAAASPSADAALSTAQP